MSEHVPPDVDVISQQGAPGGFELVLASAAFRTISDHIPGHELRTMAAALVQHPGPTLTPVIDLARQLVPIVLGSDGQRTSRDRRFADPAWRTNPLLRRIALGYLASCQAVERIVAGAEVDWRTKERVKLLADNLLAAASVGGAARDRHGGAELAARSAAACHRHGCASATSGDGRHYGVLNR